MLSQFISEIEQIRLSLLLSAQEQRFGLNMIDAMTDADEIELDRFLSRGYKYEDIVYFLFQRRYALASATADIGQIPASVMPSLSMDMNDDSAAAPAVVNKSRSVSQYGEDNSKSGADASQYGGFIVVGR